MRGVRNVLIGNIQANGVYEIRQGGYSHYIQQSLNTMFIKGYGDVSQYGSVQVLCGVGRGTSYNACDFLAHAGGAGIRVNGQCRASSFAPNSDDRIKYNETPLTNCLSIISALKPQKYEKLTTPNEYGTWIPTNEEWETTDRANKMWIPEMGFIAQEVREIPELAFAVTGEEMVDKVREISESMYNSLSSNLQSEYTVQYMYKKEIIISNAQYKELDVDAKAEYNLNKIESYISNGVTITPEDYNELSGEERVSYEALYNYNHYERFDEDEYMALGVEERASYEKYISAYKRIIPTETPLSLDYNSIFTTTVGAVQELNEKVKNLELRVATLEGN